ncbi:hypothetical protein BRE01_63440 [Brevibacillus reuszeri]|uniref:DUF3139 domain-containing protein n=1 Tax=Brevibacillus reuszeri TaxID=54915 RepID=A0A0K9YNT4_9BACL|nr:hypothetical protein [Brevibacillus reuszeri]KNB70327.1 hypothetical protein ADS79_15305 [Brevibacillus reuszeri]MED1859290.1 hypothetical protein [Brevibacillus reuszeri]GED72642.1 hypothetical protein BRE01_63440 [Brevibacillus reuszeri]
MDATKKSKIIIASFLAGAVLLAIVAVLGMSSTNEEHIATIQQVIQKQGGVIAAKGITVVPLDESPFENSGKGNTIYRIYYTKDGQNLTAWFRSENHSSIKKEPEEWILPK